MIVFEGRSVLLPLGSDTSCILLFTTSRKGVSEDLRSCPVHVRRDRQVQVKNLRLNVEGAGEEMAKYYFKELTEAKLWHPYELLEAGETVHGQYVIVSEGGGHFLLWWFTPNGDHLIEVHYVLAKENFEELGGISELRRFARRVRLLP